MNRHDELNDVIVTGGLKALANPQTSTCHSLVLSSVYDSVYFVRKLHVANVSLNSRNIPNRTTLSASKLSMSGAHCQYQYIYIQTYVTVCIMCMCMTYILYISRVEIEHIHVDSKHIFIQINAITSDLNENI